ncbi:hypothetical protein JCM3263A_10440 [Thermobifida fusca]|jgi:hypothetical protein|uniref:Uncharacterized protein n=2 Tax=Thermobifida fusca TaxID=2021 RepID=A0A9P2TBA8_THEFU|nr:MULTISPECIES: hypothetical protein [Thermobifida]AAZ54909.1 hypothetical protein Tfu_0871 [Thermobifida fusca YX]EOR72022.1 hypothetical protein TM51_04733 [Thermobifida fusca TM51]MBO2529237.1 hypothetical protein [Thermobifida sp.]MDD6790967.1 hypothetical protein [Thermobifida fusca]PPS92699.1 hypothetical protein BH05_09345 [Thermobifida fusca]
MRYRIVFIAGFAIGYILGAKAGRERYEQIARAARSLVENPTVRETADRVRSQVTDASKTVYDKLSEKLPVTSVRDFLASPTPEEEAELDRIEAASGTAARD